ncbi:MAG: hypothetical protein OXI43_06680 [Candidatus Poribacteria bacterium]|nr:hypothetical protein [Candidatus Poribacteria bacterium]
MPIFRLEGDDITNAKLVIAQETDLELESHLEDWLENSPWALIQDELILWIDRQPSARDEEGTVFPDLLGVDAEGNLVIVELKRDQAPREVVAQLLEYAAWANDLSDKQIQQIAEDYFETHGEFNEKQFHNVYKDVFEIADTDEMPPLNRNLRLYIVAGNIPTRVARVCRFLRTSQGMDINCIDVSTFETKTGERLVSMEAKVGDEDVIAPKTQRHRTTPTSRWSGDKLVKDVVWEAVEELMQGDKEFFAPKEVTACILEKYPDFNSSTVSCQIASDCVNHTSRHHYPGGSDRYWWISKGKYRLYDPEKDKVENTADTLQD